MKTKNNNDKSADFFSQRIGELARRAMSGEICATRFLTPEEFVHAKSVLCGFSELSISFFGGYADAERGILVIYPNYIPEESISQADYIIPVSIITSGYVRLEHRSFLGSLIGIGIERDAIGDILIEGDTATVFVSPSVADFLLSFEHPLEKVGSDKVTVKAGDAEKISTYRRSFTETVIVVSSPRVDCITAELGKMSREKAKEAISHGEVSLNHVTEIEPADILKAGDTISIRRHGKFKIGEINLTRKDRFRISVFVYG